MKVERLIPILNVSNIEESFAWFEKLGWKKGWDWGDPPDFGGVCSGECEIFLCQNGQGSRGGPMPQHVGDDDTGGGLDELVFGVASRGRCQLSTRAGAKRDSDRAAYG